MSARCGDTGKAREVVRLGQVESFRKMGDSFLSAEEVATELAGRKRGEETTVICFQFS